MSPVRFRPRVQEIEPRLVPSGGDWHALVQAGKALAQAGRQDPAVVAALTDPFCNGADPGPCAMPDVVRLRANLYQLRTTIYDSYLHWNLEAFDAQDELRQLIANGAPVGQWWPVQLEVDYDTARWNNASRDAADLDIENHPDNQLKAWAEGVWQRWDAAAAADARAEKQFKADYREAARASPPDGNRMLRDERNMATWQGYFDQQVEDIMNFNYYVSQP
jgi:hypothetical protein